MALVRVSFLSLGFQLLQFCRQIIKCIWIFMQQRRRCRRRHRRKNDKTQLINRFPEKKNSTKKSWFYNNFLFILSFVCNLYRIIMITRLFFFLLSLIFKIIVCVVMLKRQLSTGKLLGKLNGISKIVWRWRQRWKTTTTAKKLYIIHIYHSTPHHTYRLSAIKNPLTESADREKNWQKTKSNE